MASLVKLMHGKSSEWGDLSLPISILRGRYYDTMKHPDIIKEDRKSIMDIIDTYQKAINLPWKRGSIPPPYRTTKRSVLGNADFLGIMGYINPKYNEMYIRNPSPFTYLHEKGHILQQQPGNPLRKVMEDLLSKQGKTKDTQHQIEYSKRPGEIEADRFANFIMQLIGKKGMGVDINDPYLELFKESEDTAGKGKPPFRSFMSR